MHLPSNYNWEKREKKVEATFFLAPNSNPTCLELRQLTLGELNIFSGCQSAKNKIQASSQGADYFGGKVWLKQKIGDRERSHLDVHTNYIQNTYLDSEYFRFSQREKKFEKEPPRINFSASLWQFQSRSGPLLLPTCNHGRGAAAAEWDPIIGAFVHNTEWPTVLWERGEGVRERVSF